jgi:hypothetical protein
MSGSALDGDAPSSPAPPPQAWCYGTPGIAGTLALAVAFERSAGLPVAARKAKLLEKLLLRDLSRVEGMGADRSLLTGAPGVLSILHPRVRTPRQSRRARE